MGIWVEVGTGSGDCTMTIIGLVFRVSGGDCTRIAI